MGFEVFRTRTLVSEHGGIVNSAYHVPVQDRRTRAIRYRQLDADLEYTPKHLDEAVTVTSAGYDLMQAELRTTSSREFIEMHKDELLALGILYSNPPKRRLTYQSIQELAQRLTDPPYRPTTANVCAAIREAGIEAA